MLTTPPVIHIPVVYDYSVEWSGVRHFQVQVQLLIVATTMIITSVWLRSELRFKMIPSHVTFVNLCKRENNAWEPVMARLFHGQRWGSIWCVASALAKRQVDCLWNMKNFPPITPAHRKINRWLRTPLIVKWKCGHHKVKRFLFLRLSKEKFWKNHVYATL